MRQKTGFPFFARNTRGATTTEYGILGGLVAAVVIVALLAFGPRVSEVFGFASDEIVLGSGENPIEQRSEKPEPFAIPPKQVEEEEVLVESDTVRLRGYNVPIPVAVSGEGAPELKVGAGEWAPATTLLPKTPFQVRLTSGPMDGSAREATVDANGVTGTFLVSSADITPDTFSFEPQTGIGAGASIYFPPVTITGLTAPAPVSAAGDGNPAFSVDGGTFGTEGVVEDGQPLELRLDALDVEDGGTIETQVFVGTVAATASATMKDTLPDAFVIAAKTDVTPSARLYSDPVTPTGLADPSPISVTGEGNPAVVIDGGIEVTSDFLSPGSSFSVAMDAPETADGSSRTATVELGTVAADFTASTADLLPEAFAFAPVTDANGDTLVTASAVAISGLSAPVEATVSGDGNPALSVNGGPWGTPVTVADGDMLNVRLTSPASQGLSRIAFVTAGLGSAEFEVTTKDELPEAFAIAAATGTGLSEEVTSSAVTVTGFDASIPISVAGDGDPLLSIDGGPWAASGTLEPGETFRVRLTSSSASATTSSATVTAGGVSSVFAVTTGDAVPNAFAFAPATAQPLDTQVASSPATVTGLGIAAPVSVSGDGSPQVSIAGGAWATSGTVTNGQTVAVRLTSSSAEAETRTATVDIGGVTADFDVTTADATPDAFVIAAVNDADFNTYISSAAVTPSGFDANVSVSLSGHGSAGFRVDNGSGYGAWRVSPASLAPGGQVQVRLMSDGVSSSSRVATLTIGGVSANFTVTTGDATPDAFAFASLTAQPLNTLVTSAPVTVSGLGIAAPVSVSGEGSPQISIDGGAWTTSGTVSSGQYVLVRLTSANAESTSRTATVTIGGVSANFAVTTADMTPANFAFAAQTGVALSTLTASNGTTISGIDTAVDVSVSGQGSPQFQIYTGDSWGAWRSSAATLSSGDGVKVRLTSAGTGNTTRTATLTVGSLSRNFSVTTGAGCTPGSQTFDYTGANQTFVVPAGCTSLTVRAWGAGGGYIGGGGGYATRTLAVTPGAIYTVVVGAGGAVSSVTGGYGGGGAAGDGPQGGGYAGVFAGSVSQANAVLVAGGGGGGIVATVWWQPSGPYRPVGGLGGGGGGLSGSAATTILGTGGGGGTQSAGGSAQANATAGAALRGGNGGRPDMSFPFGGGGGGGYFGGGGGNISGGGGGSSYAPGGSTVAGQTPVDSGTPAMPGSPTEALGWTAGIGVGGSGAAAGGNGRVVVLW